MSDVYNKSVEFLFLFYTITIVAEMQIFIKSITFFLLQMKSHCDTDCPKAPITCNFNLFGCKERVSTKIEAALCYQIFVSTTT